MHLACADVEVVQGLRSPCGVDRRGNLFEFADARLEESGSFVGELLLIGERKSENWNNELQDVRARGLPSNENV